MQLDACCFFRGLGGERKVRKTSSTPCARQEGREGGEREGYGEKRSSVFYDMGACCSTGFKMLLTGSRWEEETQMDPCGQDPLRDKLTNTHTNAHTELMLYTCEDLVVFITSVFYYNPKGWFWFSTSICMANTAIMGYPSGLGVKGAHYELQSTRLESGCSSLLHVIPHLSLRLISCHFCSVQSVIMA